MGRSSSYKPQYYRGTHTGSGEKELEKSQHPFFSNRSYSGQSEISSPFFQTKLSIGQPNDQYEQEADRVADKVVNQKGPAAVVQQKEISSVQRLATSEEDEKVGTNDARMLKDKELQTKPDVKEENEEVQTKSEGKTSAPPSLSSRISNSSGKGMPLPSKTLQQMNSSFGADFSDVNLHTDYSSIRMNNELRSQAFTHGKDIYFNSGKYNPETSTGKQLLAHELTHVVQQGSGNGLHNSVQRACHDGACDSCLGGQRDFWITFYFRRKATRKTMTYLRQQIRETKQILKNCCLNLKADFNWTLLGGGGTFDPLVQDAGGNWSYSADASALGTGNTFAGSRGIPVLVVDHVEDSGGGVTVTQNQTFDASYTGRNYAVIGVNQQNPNPGCNHLAHELWHVGQGEGHDPAFGTLAACQGNDVSPEFCRGLRNIVAPVGDFPVPSRTTAVA
ncbi:MAG TPA: DUF4157 domain-containing protein [Chryseolinea sp.]